ncbi:hypothetical protein HJFPF1_00178 [Paramyrothecium foliicola]|nr:hypothetical protein HJFPF1_00178 [Paramyrothecium foliicola]
MVTSEGNHWIEAASVNADAHSPQRATRSFVIDLQYILLKHGTAFRLTVCDSPVPSGTIPVFAKSKNELIADYLPQYAINEAKYYLDLDRRVLHLDLWAPSFSPIPHRIFLRVSNSNGKVKEFNFSDMKPFASGQRTVSVQVANIRPPIDATLQVVVEDNETKAQRVGPSRRLTVPYSRLPVPVLSVQIVSPGSIKVSCIALRKVFAVDVSVTPLAGLLGEVTQEAMGTMTSATLTAQSGSQWTTSAGSPFKIKVMAKNPGVLGKASELYYVVPKDNKYVIAKDTESQPLIADLAAESRVFLSAPVNTDVVVSGTVLWGYSAKDGLVGIQNPQLLGNNTARKRVIIAPSRKASVSPKPEDMIHHGSGFASATLANCHEYIFWVDTKGAIQVAGTANNSSGGILGAKVMIKSKETQERVHVWWLNGANELVTSVYTPSEFPEDDDGEWNEIDTLVSGANMTPATHGCLAVCQSSPSSNEIFWTTNDGRLYGMNDGNLYALADTSHDIDRVDSVSPECRIATLQLSNKDTFIFWIAKDGSVLSALRPSSADATTSAISLVVGTGSAAPASDIATGMLSTSKAEKTWIDPRVWWFDSQGQIFWHDQRRTKPALIFGI